MPTAGRAIPEPLRDRILRGDASVLEDVDRFLSRRGMLVMLNEISSPLTGASRSG